MIGDYRLQESHSPQSEQPNARQPATNVTVWEDQSEWILRLADQGQRWKTESGRTVKDGGNVKATVQFL